MEFEPAGTSEVENDGEIPVMIKVSKAGLVL